MNNVCTSVDTIFFISGTPNVDLIIFIIVLVVTENPNSNWLEQERGLIWFKQMKTREYNDSRDGVVSLALCVCVCVSVCVCLCGTQQCASPFRLVLTQPQMAARSMGWGICFWGSYPGNRTPSPSPKLSSEECVELFIQAITYGTDHDSKGSGVALFL